MSHASSLGNIKAVSFDLDDTFWDCDPVISAAESRLNAWLHEKHPSAVAGHTSESLLAMRSEMYKTHPHLKTDVSAMRTTFLEQLLAEESEPLEAARVAFDVFYRARSEVTLYDGTIQLLDAIHDRYKIAAITNGNADLNLIGIARYFQAIQAADLQTPPKPATTMFERVCKKFQIQPGELLHVGDNPETDVQGAHNAGAITVWFNQQQLIWPTELRPPHFEVKSLGELQALLSTQAGNEAGDQACD